MVNAFIADYRESRLLHMKKKLGTLRHGQGRLRRELEATDALMSNLERQIRALELRLPRSTAEAHELAEY
ncbi:MAG: hypothetical protein AB8E74_08785 [Prochlorococcus sp.]|nr:hypothetical protein [Prochlorococcaceae cyanobacterium Fu_MAG_50]